MGGAAERLVKNDLKTFSKILEFADISKEFDICVLGMLLEALTKSNKNDKNENAVETFFNLARHNVLVILFQMLIALKEKVLTNYKKLQIKLLFEVLYLFNSSLFLKRIQN